MKIKKRNISKDAKFSSQNKALKLYGLDPIWKVTLKVASSGLIMSFFLGLFTFVDQLMLVNIMPDTHVFSFNSLFYHNGNGVFNNLLDNINSQTYGHEIYQLIKSQQGTDKRGLEELIYAIANSSGLSLSNSAFIVRSAVSLTGALSIIINAIPGFFAVGTAVKYTQALGRGDYRSAAHIWQNAFVGCITAGLFCFCLLIILIPTVIPAQNVQHILQSKDIEEEYEVIMANLAAHGYHNNDFLQATFNSNGSIASIKETIYYGEIDGKLGYFAKIGSNEYVNLLYNQMNDSSIAIQQANVTLPSFNLTVLNTANVSDPSSVFETWTNYNHRVWELTNRWAENFLFIMAAGCTLFALANLLGVILRADGAIVVSTVISVTTVVINIALDFIFIKVAQIGMEGAACASVVGWIIQCIWSGFYMQYSTKIHSYANFTVLQKKYLAISKKVMYEIMLFGLSMLIGTVIYSVSNIILTNQVTAISSEILTASNSEYYLSVLGAITPILNLFYFTIFGLIRTNSPIFAYNYSAKRIDRVRQAYWWNLGLILAFGCLVLGLIGFCAPIKDGILSWFRVTASSPDGQLYASSKLMWVWMTEIPMLTLATGGMFIYRATNRLGTSYIVALLRSGIYSIPTIFIFSAVAVNYQSFLNNGLSSSEIPVYENNAIWFFFYNVPVATAGYGLTVFIMSTVFIYKYLGRPVRRKTSEIWPNSLFVKHYYNKIFDESLVKNYK